MKRPVKRDKKLFKAIRAYDAKGVRTALAAGASANASENGSTPLSYAAARGQRETVSFLLDGGASVSAVDNGFGRTPLHWAAYYGHTETASLLLERGADLDAQDKDGFTPLHVAVNENRYDMAAMLRTHISARDLTTTLDSARPPETVPEPPARPRLFAGPNDPPVRKDPMGRPRREKLDEPDPQQPIKPGRMRL